MNIGTTVLALLCGFEAVYGSTSFAPLATVTEYGRPVSYCSYKGVRFLPESVFTDLDGCIRCECSTSGLDCQTISGRTSGFPANSQCEAIQIGCKNIWVLRNNQNQVCPVVPSHSMTGK